MAPGLPVAHPCSWALTLLSRVLLRHDQTSPREPGQCVVTCAADVNTASKQRPVALNEATLAGGDSSVTADKCTKRRDANKKGRGGEWGKGGGTEKRKLEGWIIPSRANEI